MAERIEVEANDLVQITDEAHAWFPCILLVTEVKAWGVQAAVLIPESNSANEIAQAFNRLSWGTFERVGRSVVERKKLSEGF